MNKKFKYDAIIKLYIEKYPELIENKTAFARLIIEKENLPFNDDYFRRFIRSYMDRNNPTLKPKLKTKTPTIEIPYNSKAIKDAPRYKIRNKKYVWEGKHGHFTIPIDVADQLFYEYSRHGLDLSSTELRLKHDISLKMWYSLKFHLGLYKDSHIISPFTLDNTPKEDLRSLINERMMAKEQDKERVIIEEHNKATIKNYNKLINELKIKDVAIEKMLDDLSENLDIPEIKQVVFSPISSSKKHYVISIADLHIGAEAKNLLITPDFNKNILRDRLSAIAAKINKLNADKISLLFIGDFIESITGLNHISTWQHVESGEFGAQVFKSAIEILIEFINQIANVHQVIGVSGNHDRTTPDKKMDPYNSIAEMIFYVLHKIYTISNSNINVYFHNMLQSITIDGINYIISHGDKNVFKKKNLGSDSVLTYGKPGMFNIVLTAHLHSRDIIADHHLYRWVQVPSVFSGDFYSESNGFTALPGFISIYNDDGLPVITDYSI